MPSASPPRARPWSPSLATAGTGTTPDELQAAGLTIIGAQAGDLAGARVAPAGDVNGDGRPDLVVGAYGAVDAQGSPDQGAAYVVFGRAAGGTVDLAHLGTGGFHIDGTPGSWLG